MEPEEFNAFEVYNTSIGVIVISIEAARTILIVISIEAARTILRLTDVRAPLQLPFVFVVIVFAKVA
jgi:hypothetical protein